MPEAVIFIPLTQGKVAVIDFEDFDKVRDFKWHTNKVGRNFYARRNRKKSDGPGPSKVFLHQVITNCPEGLEPDHKNGDGLDNRKENLRVGTRSANGRGFITKRLGVSSKFRGVSWNTRNGSWDTRIKKHARQIFLGYFSSEEDAARAYDKKAIELGFANEALNFPNI